MSARRLLSVHKPFAATILARNVPRLYSTVPPSGRSSLRLLVYGVAAGTLTVGGSLVYANYDPVFRNRVSEYVPGFGATSDYAADKWVQLMDAVRPQQPSGNVGLGKKDVSTGVVIPPKPTSPTTLKKTIPIDEKKDVESTHKEEPKPKARVIKIEPQQDKAAPPTPAKSSPPLSPPPAAPADAVSPTSQKKEVNAEPKKMEPVERVNPNQKNIQTGEKEKAQMKESEESKKQAKKSSTVSPPQPIKSSEKTAQQAATVEQAADIKPQLKPEELEATEVASKKLQVHFEEFATASGAVLEAQKTLAQAVLEHGKLLASVTDSPTSDDNMAATSEAVSSSEKAVENARNSLSKALADHKKTISSLQTELPKALSVGCQALVGELEKKMAALGAELLAATTMVAAAESSSKAASKEAVSLREELQKELGTTLPEVGSQVEALLLMFQKKVNTLKQSLEETVCKQEADLTAALEKQKQSLEEDAEKKVSWLVQKKELELHQELKQKVEEVAKNYEAELKEKLMIQSDIHTKNLARSLQSQADELGGMWEQRLEEKLSEEAFENQKVLSRALGRIKGIELMVDAVANAGAETRRQQGLRTSCDAVNNTMELANISAEPNDRFSLTEEVSSLREAARGDNFIAMVLDSLPPAAMTTTGIQSQSALIERFKKVKRIARRVALVPATGGGLETYGLSLLQSMLTFDLARRQRKELDPAKMDTFDILQEADAHLGRGDLEGAVFVLNHLQGEAGRAASDWLADARLYLETKQAVNLIENYVAASSVSLAQ